MTGLPANLRSELRFFAYYLGNGTLLLPAYDIDLDYAGVVTRGDDTIGRLFALLLTDSYHELNGAEQVHQASYDRVRAWLAAQCDPTAYAAPALAAPERDLAGFAQPWKDAVVDFGRKLGRAALCPDVLDGYVYLPDLFENGGSWLEAVVTVYANVLRVDAGGRPTNAAHAERRAAQMLRAYFDHDFDVVPPFEEWERELNSGLGE